jgi:hypothetical protein
MATQARAKTEDLYEEDFYVWTEAQAALLRERRFEALDLANLIEEVEGLGDAKKSAVLNNASVIIEHLLKLQHSPAQDRRRGWSESIIEHRGRLEIELTRAAARLRPDPAHHGTEAPPLRRGYRGRRATGRLPLHGRADHRRLVAVG